jgi:hypothetical protein
MSSKSEPDAVEVIAFRDAAEFEVWLAEHATCALRYGSRLRDRSQRPLPQVQHPINDPSAQALPSDEFRHFLVVLVLQLQRRYSPAVGQRHLHLPGPIAAHVADRDTRIDLVEDQRDG